MRPVALITGASAGIGEAFAKALAPTHDLVLVARRADRLEAIARGLQGNHRVVPADLSDPHAPEAIARAVGDIDMLVNNAGTGVYDPFVESDVDTTIQTMALNMAAPTLLTRAFLPGMVERKRGAVINVASLAAYLPLPYGAVYGATKAYLLSFSEALAEELNGTGVKVLCVCPGAVETEMQQYSKVRPEVHALGQPVSAEQVAKQALFALSMGERVSIAGLHNQVAASLAPFAPRPFTNAIAGWLFGPR
ncbi:MAG: family NAD(P)-dependent oxidoreductase [Cyanobacteria bacterium RYN_339]|nr:family NAD(P)-dependent oxidoreductase [Cyanobacteria bacterium RYN_339]